MTRKRLVGTEGGVWKRQGRGMMTTQSETDMDGSCLNCCNSVVLHIGYTKKGSCVVRRTRNHSLKLPPSTKNQSSSGDILLWVSCWTSQWLFGIDFTCLRYIYSICLLSSQCWQPCAFFLFTYEVKPKFSMLVQFCIHMVSDWFSVPVTENFWK